MQISHMRYDAGHMPSAIRARWSRGNRMLSPLLLAGAVALLSGCGGGSSMDRSSGRNATDQHSASETRASENGEAGSASTASKARTNSQSAKKSSKQSQEGNESENGSAVSGKGSASNDVPGYQKLVDNQPSKPRTRFTPCNLVSKAQAQAIVGAPLADPFEATQGPTCIYRTSIGKTFITVAIQSVRFEQLRPQIRDAQRIAVLDRKGYCGKVGQSMMYVPLSARRVLTVAAPCDVAKQFALKAIPNL